MRDRTNGIRRLTPPSSKLKARFMNLEDQLNWADKILALLDGLPGSALSWVTPQRLEEKLGWVASSATTCPNGGSGKRSST